MTVSIEIPTNNDWTSFQTYSESETFTLRVHPCILTSFTSASVISDVSYKLGDPQLDDFTTFTFEQVNSCGYPETYSITSTLGVTMFTIDQSLRTLSMSYSEDTNLIAPDYDAAVIATI